MLPEISGNLCYVKKQAFMLHRLPAAQAASTKAV
jgi:hypothetical protein